MKRQSFPTPLGRAPDILIRRALYSLALLPLIHACGTKTAMQSDRTVPRRYVNGSFVVALSDGASSQSLSESAQSIAKDYHCQSAQSHRIDWGGDADVLPEALAHSFNVTMTGCALSPAKTREMMERFASTDGVMSVEAEALAQAIATDGDPYRGQQFYMDTIHRDQACAASRKSQKPVVVAVIDTGAEKDHPDLQDAFLRGSDGKVVGANFVGKGYAGAPDEEWNDGQGHGTHVTGTIAATANNGQGIAGVASCANVKIMPVRALDDKGRGSTLEINRAIKWAVDHGANVINMSLGHTAFSRTPKPSSFQDPTLAYAQSRGVAVFAAAGNESLENGKWTRMTDELGQFVDEGYAWSFPASNDGVIAVAATREDGRLASFSNYGERIDVAAPGQDIVATFIGHRYSRLSGTSMASPVATATYALALGNVFDRTASLKESDIIGLLNASTNGQALTKDKVASGGVIDAAKLVTAITREFGGGKDEPTPPGNGLTPVPPTKPTEPSEPTQPSQPTDPRNPSRPSDPTPDQPAPTLSMRFSGLTDGQTLTGALQLGVENLPEGTYRVDFYWGRGLWRFESLYVNEGESKVLSQDRWNLYGHGKLHAIAYSRTGRALKLISVELDGLSR